LLAARRVLLTPTLPRCEAADLPVPPKVNLLGMLASHWHQRCRWNRGLSARPKAPRDSGYLNCAAWWKGYDHLWPTAVAYRCRSHFSNRGL